MNFKSIKIHKLNQFSYIQDKKGTYYAVIKIKDIIDSLSFTYRRASNLDLNGINENEKNYYQRVTNNDRVINIIQYLLNQYKNENSLITFPTTFILSANSIENELLNTLEENLNFESFESKITNFIQQTLYDHNRGDKLLDLKEEREELEKLYTNCYLSADKDSIYNLFYPTKPSILIVDGQHRLSAFKLLITSMSYLLNQTNDRQNFEITLIKKVANLILKELEIQDNQEILKNLKSKVEDFEINCTILYDYDIWEQSKVFADVNFNQKPVNKSLYYDIYGSFPNENRNDIYLVHNWCKSLNYDDDSVLQNKIKMLGSGQGFISQAFFCDSFLPLVRRGGIWYYDITNYELEKVDNTDLILTFLKGYFKAFYEIYKESYWPKELDTPYSSDSILLKTTGFGALVRLIPYFFETTKIKNKTSSDAIALEVIDIIKSRLFIDNLNKKYPDPKQLEINIKKANGAYYFSKNEGAFSKGAGKGLQDKLFLELKNDLNFN